MSAPQPIWMSSYERPAIPHVLVEHLEELMYLSIQRRKLLFSPEVPLRRLRSHEQRMEAHLDGLRTAGPAGAQVAAGKVSGDDPWLVATAVRVWITLAQPSGAEVMERLKDVTPELAAAWKEALRGVPTSAVHRALPQQNLETLSPTLQAIVVDALGWHGILSPLAAASLSKSPDSSVRFAVARTRPVGDVLLSDPDLMVRRAALWSAALGNPAGAVDRSRQSLRAGVPDPFSIRVLGLLGQVADGKSLVAALGRPEASVPALFALRDLGHAEFADGVAELLDSRNEEIAAVAVEVLQSLVGPLPAPDKNKPAPEGVSPVRYRWREARSQLDLSGRKLHGKPFPWTGDAADEPMECVWRRACASGSADTAWLRREVPDGFFSGEPSATALPGE